MGHTKRLLCPESIKQYATKRYELFLIREQFRKMALKEHADLYYAEMLAERDMLIFTKNMHKHNCKCDQTGGKKCWWVAFKEGVQNAIEVYGDRNTTPSRNSVKLTEAKTENIRLKKLLRRRTLESKGVTGLRFNEVVEVQTFVVKE